MYKDQNSFIARAMEYLEIAARYVLLNLIWILSIVPFAAVFFLILRYAFGLQEAPWVLIFIPIVMASPATGGLYYATNQLAHGRDGGLMAYWQGVKIYVWPSYRWGIANLILAFLLSVNIWFYGDLSLEIAPYLQIVFVVTALFWAALQTYTFPLLIEQEEPSLKTALRNSLVAVARFPLRSFGFLLLVIAIVFLSTYLFFVLWLLVTVSFLAYLSNKHTLIVLEKLLIQERERKEQQNEE